MISLAKLRKQYVRARISVTENAVYSAEDCNNDVAWINQIKKQKIKEIGQKFSNFNVVCNVAQSVMGGNVVYFTLFTFDSSLLKQFYYYVIFVPHCSQYPLMHAKSRENWFLLSENRPLEKIRQKNFHLFHFSFFFFLLVFTVFLFYILLRIKGCFVFF